MMPNQSRVAHIMVVDDEAAARVSLAEILRLQGYHVATAASGEEALSQLGKAGPFDLMMLDLKMPGMDGLAVIEAVGKVSPQTVIILLTAFGTLDTAIRAMRQGAHDYLLKPCPIPEILESVRKGLDRQRRERQRQQLVGQLRRTLTELVEVAGEGAAEAQAAPQSSRFLQVRDIVVDRQKRVVMLAGRPLDLTPTEFKILVCLLETPDQIWSPKELVERAQGYETDAWGARAVIRVHIRRLRKKIEKDASNPQYILNVRGVGYMLASANPESD
jgi:DNA-binding response OmpR family regulator